MKLRVILPLLAAALLGTFNQAWAQSAPTAGATTEQVQQAMKSQLPAPPAGFDWKLYKNAAFLKPASWNEREAKPVAGTFPTSTYATSPESFSEATQFETGFTITIISGTQRLRGLEAKKAVSLFLKPILDTHKREEVLMLDRMTNGDYERTVLRYRDAPPGLKPVIVHKFVLANNVTDSMHIFTFESPESTWTENWEKYGTPILSRLQVVAQLPVN